MQQRTIKKVTQVTEEAAASTARRDARRARGGVFNVLADTTTTDAKPAAEAKPEPELLSDVRSRSPRRDRPLSRSRVLSLRSR